MPLTVEALGIVLFGTVLAGAVGATLCFLRLLSSPLRSIHAAPALEGDA